MDCLTLENKYPDYDFHWLEKLELYHAFDDSHQEYLIDRNGDNVYGFPENNLSERYLTNFSFSIWDKWETDFNSQIHYWIEIKLSQNITSCNVFSFREGSVIRLLESELILEAVPVTPQKLLLQVAADKDNPFARVKIYLYDILKDERTELLDIPYEKSPFSTYRVFGVEQLFSVLIRKEEHAVDHFMQEIFSLYNPCGDPLLNFETTIGQNGERTCFEPS